MPIVNMRSLTVSELIQALLDLKQPHARVEVRGEVVAPDAGYNLVVDAHMHVTDVHSRHGVVVLEGKDTIAH